MVNSKNVVFETSFPMYCVRTLAGRHVLVAGGGGQAKTGVPNCLENFLFDLDAGSWDFRKTNVVNTGDEATMNMDICAFSSNDGRYLVACGLGGNCRVYETQLDIAEFIDGQLMLSDNNQAKNSINQNAATLKNGIINAKKVVKKLKLNFRELRTFQTDFSPMTGPKSGGPFQKVVKFGANGTLIGTGGADGHFRIWNVSNFGKIFERKAHKDDIDDLDFSPNGSKLVTVGRDSAGFIWSIKNAVSQLADLADKNYDALPPKYRFRFCRFSKPSNSNIHQHNRDKNTDKVVSSSQILYTVSIPVVRTAKKQPCFLARWILDEKKGGVFKCTLTANLALGDGEVISAFALSSDSHFIGFGTLNGSLSIVDALTFHPLQTWKEAHGIFVTSLDFVPSEAKIDPRLPFSPLLADAKCALISVSADNCGQLHVVSAKNKRKLSSSSLFILLLLFWAIIFYILLFLEL